MNTTEDRARAAMRAIAWTVSDAPPLHLPRRHSAAPAPWRRSRMWIAPLAAAVAVIADAAAFPRYYVALNQASADFPASLVVGNTVTGAKIATVSPPPGGTFGGVTGAAGNRTFVVDSHPGLLNDESAPSRPRTWYLLRIAPGSAHPAKLIRLPIPAMPYVEAIALSPDASKLAIAVRPGFDSPHAAVYLRVYSVASGALLRTWTAKDGSAVFGGPAYGGPDRNDALFWRGDGRTLSFISSWTVGAPRPVNGSQERPSAAQARKISVHTTLRVLEFAGSGNDMIADSRLAWSMVTNPYRWPSAAPECVSGTPDLLVSGDGKVIACAATDVFRNPGTRDSIGCRAAKPWRDLEFLEYSAVTGRRLTVLDKYPTNCNVALTAVYVLWVSQSGDAVIGYVGPGPSSPPGQRQPARRFGIFREGKFIPLPAPLTGADYLPLDQIAW